MTMRAIGLRRGVLAVALAASVIGACEPRNGPSGPLGPNGPAAPLERPIQSASATQTARGIQPAGGAPPAASAPAVPAPPVPLGSSLHGVAWVDDRTVVAVGKGGAVFRSNDRGATWKRLGSPTREYLTAIASDGGTTLALDERGALFRSTDAGSSWSKSALPPPRPSNALWSNGHGVIYAVGGDVSILRSSDGGTTWSVEDSGMPHSTPDVTDRGFSFNAVWGRSSGEVTVVADDGFVIASPTGTAPWQHAWSGAHKMLHAVTGDGRGGIVAMGGALVTGRIGSWSARSSDLDDLLLQAVWGDDHGTLVAVGSRGAVARSEDGGTSWRRIDSGTTEALMGIAGRGSAIVAVGLEGVVIHSSDGGKSWSGGRPDGG